VMCMMQCNFSRAHFLSPPVTSSNIYCYYADYLFLYSGGMSNGPGFPGENGTVTGRACPKGLYGTFCKVTYKDYELTSRAELSGYRLID
jgi:hypothetical protein